MVLRRKPYVDDSPYSQSISRTPVIPLVLVWFLKPRGPKFDVKSVRFRTFFAIFAKRSQNF